MAQPLFPVRGLGIEEFFGGLGSIAQLIDLFAELGMLVTVLIEHRHLTILARDQTNGLILLIGFRNFLHHGIMCGKIFGILDAQ